MARLDVRSLEPLGFPKYTIDNYGRVKSLARKKYIRGCDKLVPYSYQLYNEGDSQRFTTAKLLAKIFFPENNGRKKPILTMMDLESGEDLLERMDWEVWEPFDKNTYMRKYMKEYKSTSGATPRKSNPIEQGRSPRSFPGSISPTRCREIGEAYQHVLQDFLDKGMDKMEAQIEAYALITERAGISDKMLAKINLAYKKAK